MEQKDVLEALKKARAESKQRNFQQTVEIVINLQNLDLKKPEQQVDFFATLPQPLGSKVKVAGFVGSELKSDADKELDAAISVDDFKKYEDKKQAKKLASEYDYFIAQANLMPKVAASFGKILGTRGKMPNPKAGCVVPGNANLAQLYERLQSTVRVKAKQLPVVQCKVGREDMKDEAIAANVLTIYHQLVSALPNHENNIKRIMLKLTMGKVVDIR